ncbi:YjiH family protein [Lutispora saccharofermentans]|uniref:Transporter gate domain protein n=1 Tax=Lutispora saccharofermentans TaxID=3024236 RepID=A0ABT1NC78_9FIRM|nr:nucleoside recognition domain-containing protein [Lutispora saccharofermentans]MCQ1528847.1 transporter gate domain protein [Lutispora saccharofermentans]
MTKFIVFSFIGIVLFFVPVMNSQVPIVAMVDIIKKLLGPALNYLVLIVCALLVVTFVMAKYMGVERLKPYHEADGPIKGIFYVIAVVFAVMIIANKGPQFILNENVGGLAMDLAGTVMITVTLAGWLVVFILKSGIVEFLGVLIEPVMRPVFKLPGEAAVNGIASFVSAPAVGVYFTEQLYKGKVYTEKEAVAVLFNFSVCSLGFFGLLVSIGNIVELYPHVVLTSFILTFVMAAICIRIPPLSGKPNVYIDNHEQTASDIKAHEKGHAFSRAIEAALKVASEFKLKDFKDSLWDAVKFSQKIVTYVVSIATIALALTEYTSLFTWLGKPMIPLLKLFGLPNAAEIAPATIIGIVDLALPVMIIAGKSIAIKSVFFITVLASLQIIFFTESANAMLESQIPVKVKDLVLTFIIRTLIAIPLVAIVSHLIF